jgi:D-2-hydroxyacid dehydrogenase (NADP+)
VLAMMLHFSRGLDFAVHAQQASRWDTTCFDQTKTRVTELENATLGIVGYGGIGRELARRARALGMHCLATRRRVLPDDGNEVEILHGTEGLLSLLERSDYIVIAAPSTPDTYHLIATPELARVRHTAVVINVSRGSIVDQRALINALREHRIRGAGLDVFASEPLPMDSPLWQLPNVLITPHVSAVSPQYWMRELDLILDNIARYLAGQPLRNVVDKAAGY